MSWSWTALVRANGGDEESALKALQRMPGVGRYQDEVHRPSARVLPMDARPVVREARPQRPPRGHQMDRERCPGGHRMVRDGVENGRQRWRCKPCRWTARTSHVAAAAAGGG